MASSKIINYQIFSRLYSNRCQARKPFGTIEENGCGKLNDFTPSVLKQIRELGVTHVWYTGVIRHATMTDYSQYGIPRQHSAVVKGRAPVQVRRTKRIIKSVIREAFRHEFSDYGFCLRDLGPGELDIFRLKHGNLFF